MKIRDCLKIGGMTNFLSRTVNFKEKIAGYLYSKDFPCGKWPLLKKRTAFPTF